MEKIANNSFYSPLRYPGGKTKIVPIIKRLLYDNGLEKCHYIEPYAGGAGAALSLLFNEVVSTIHINDFDKSIYAFWYSIIHHNKKFCKKIKNTPVNIENWKEQKKVQDRNAEAELFELGFSTFFLNRTNISGIIKGGAIGGHKQEGQYKIDARFNKKNLINKIQKIGKYKDKITVTNEDAKIILTNQSSKNFLFIDPPYVKKAKDLYLNFYLEKDHQEVSKILLSKDINFNWLLSYDQADLIRELYFSLCKNKFSWRMNYGASNRKSQEYLIFNDNLKINKLQSDLISLSMIS